MSRLSGRSAEIRSAITFVSGRTVSASPQVTSDRPAAASHGTVSVSAATSLPANSGPKSDGASTAPKTEPKRTYEMPRARRSGGYMSPAAVLIRSVTAPAIPANAKPVTSATPECQWVPTAASV